MALRAAALALAVVMAVSATSCARTEPDEVYASALLAFVDALKEKDFDAMYALIAPESAEETPFEVFANRYKNIYGSVDAKNIVASVDRVEALNSGARRVHFTMSMDTVAGELSVENYVDVKRVEVDGSSAHLLLWTPHVIFPGVTAERPIRVDTKKAKMGSIYDRSGELLAGDGLIKAVGVLVGKLDPDHSYEDVARIAELTGQSLEALNEKLNAAWVKEGLIVPVAELSPDDVETKEKLLLIPGVRIDDKEGRVYPYGREFSKEEQYLDRLTGTDGHRIVVTDAVGNVLSTLKEVPAVDGETIWLDVLAADAKP